MLRKTDSCKEYKNGNLVIKYDSFLKEIAAKDEILALSAALSEIDCYLIGETYNLTNFETGHTVYNCYSDQAYVFAWSDLEKLNQGKAVKLYARDPDETDRETLEREGF